MNQRDWVHEVAEVDDRPPHPAEPGEPIIEGIAAAGRGEGSGVWRRGRHLGLVAVHLPHQLQTLPGQCSRREGFGNRKAIEN